MLCTFMLYFVLFCCLCNEGERGGISNNIRIILFDAYIETV